MLVHYLRRRSSFKTTMIQRLHGSNVMAGVNASAHLLDQSGGVANFSALCRSNCVHKWNITYFGRILLFNNTQNMLNIFFLQVEKYVILPLSIIMQMDE